MTPWNMRPKWLMKNRSSRVEPVCCSRPKYTTGDRRLPLAERARMDCSSRQGHRTQRASDRSIFEWAQQNHSMVITFDEDFADTRMFPIGSRAGVIRLRV